eukprot:4591759-Amphidinium_carterae.1
MAHQSLDETANTNEKHDTWHCECGCYKCFLVAYQRHLDQKRSLQRVVSEDSERPEMSQAAAAVDSML